MRIYQDSLAYHENLINDPLDLLVDPHVLFAKLWCTKRNNAFKLIFVDDGENSSYYLFTETFHSDSAPYVKLSEMEAIKFVHQFIYQLFNNPPPALFSDYEFAKRTLLNIKIQITVTRLTIDKNLPPGLAFQSGYVGHYSGKRLFDFIPYSQKTFVTNVLPLEPSPFMFEEASRHLYLTKLNNMTERSVSLPENIINETTKSNNNLEKTRFSFDDQLEHIQGMINDDGFQYFLKVLTEEDPIKAVALRSTLRRIITAKRDGTQFHQGQAFNMGDYDPFTAVEFMGTSELPREEFLAIQRRILEKRRALKNVNSKSKDD